jgi:hypothetical protein
MHPMLRLIARARAALAPLVTALVEAALETAQSDRADPAPAVRRRRSDRPAA